MKEKNNMMNRLIIQSEKFLQHANIPFVRPGEFGEIENERVEVIFSVSEAQDPNVAIVDPPDVRVWVYIKTGMVELIQQM